MKNLICILIIALLLIHSNLCFAESDWGINMEEELEENGKIYMEGGFLNGDLLKITVFSKDFQTPVLGISFHLKYDGENLAFLRYDPGDFLESGGDPFYLVQNDELRKKLIFGATLRRDDSFPVGEGQVAHFYFQILQGGEEFIFEFENGVISYLDVIRQDIVNVVFEDLYLNKNKVESDKILNIGESLKASISSGGRYFPVLISFTLLMTFLSILLTIFLIKKGKNQIP